MVDERADVLRIIYEDRDANTKYLHIIDQLTLLRNSISHLHEKKQKIVFRLIMRAAAAAPNAQTGCERANSDYNITKTKLYSSMKLPIIKARLRIKSNGPP